MTKAELIGKTARVINSCQTIPQLAVANKYAWRILDKLYPVSHFWGTDWESRISFAKMIETDILTRERVINQ